LNPDFAINELSIQSIITSPTHGELIPLAASTSTTYTVKGYAYSGMLPDLKVARVVQLPLTSLGKAFLYDGSSWKATAGFGNPVIGWYKSDSASHFPLLTSYKSSKYPWQLYCSPHKQHMLHS
jgi:hypothetical protein